MCPVFFLPSASVVGERPKGTLYNGEELFCFLDVDNGRFEVYTEKDDRRYTIKRLPHGPGVAWLPQFQLLKGGTGFSFEVIDPKDFPHDPKEAGLEPGEVQDPNVVTCQSQ